MTFPAAVSEYSRPSVTGSPAAPKRSIPLSFRPPAGQEPHIALTLTRPRISIVSSSLVFHSGRIAAASAPASHLKLKLTHCPAVPQRLGPSTGRQGPVNAAVAQRDAPFLHNYGSGP